MILLSLVTLVAADSSKASSRDECYHDNGMPRRCSPPFQNIAHERKVIASNTCGMDGPETFYRQVQSSESSLASGMNERSLRYTCDDRDPRRQHNARFLTDTESKTTWWQSQTLDAADLQYPANVSLTLHLEKAYEITYVRLKFYSPRPESLIIEKRTCEECPWVKYQYYSNTCRETFGRPDTYYLQYDNEPLCDSKMSKISPLSGGEIVFSTLEGRPSNANFEQSEILQEFVTATDIRITLVRLNTFGDEIFRGTKVLQSYYYAISDLVVGGKIKCNGHASDHSVVGGRVVCNCHHNTGGNDCERCLPLYNNKPWTRATSKYAQTCEKCDCNGLADSCIYDPSLGHGRCIDCQHNSDGYFCEKCRPGFYRDPHTNECIPCSCDQNGSRNTQCDINGQCECHHGVEGEKCDRCQPKFFNLARGGCQPCNCHIPGSLDNTPTCDPISGQCTCKANVVGQKCKQCKVGFMGAENSYGEIAPDIDNPFGCIPCFCFGHSNTCSPASHMVKAKIESRFDYNSNQFMSGSQNVTYQTLVGQISAMNEFTFPAQYLANQRYSYNQHLSFDLAVDHTVRTDPHHYVVNGNIQIEGLDKDNQLLVLRCPLEHNEQTSPSAAMGKFRFRLHEQNFIPRLDPVQFISVLNDLQAIKVNFDGYGTMDNVQMGTAVIGIPGIDGKVAANHIETCEAQHRSNDGSRCTADYTFNSETDNPYQPCNKCNCNSHSRRPCDPVTGMCQCEHNTCGTKCDSCCSGFYGDPFQGTANDCKACPCPDQGACTFTLNNLPPVPEIDSIPVNCVNCPPGSGGARCERCLENHFGDPRGLFGAQRDCQKCHCNGNTNVLALGNCNRVTGECLQCLFNTEGDSCERCSPGYYGNPLIPGHEQSHGKGCTACQCNKKGSINDVCDVTTGQCQCYPGVTGLNCDQCMVEHYGLIAGVGCESCDCDPVGSLDGNCDVEYGQCNCLPGVTGRRCDQCQPNHYDFSRDGCKSCDCDQVGSLHGQCDLYSGQCVCRDGVMGKKCDKCQENYFYDRNERTCQRCDKCYDLVQWSVDQHRSEMKRLNDLKNEIISNPHEFIDDSEFEREINKLKWAAQDLKGEANRVQADFKLFEETLEDTNQSMDQVQLQLSQFASSLETCERTVSQSRVYQHATSGTITVIERVLTDIQEILADAELSIDKATVFAEDQKQRHGALRSLYAQAGDALSTHQSESEKVQLAAQSALETSKRAGQQIVDAIHLIKDLKTKLQSVSNNDVQSAKDRIISLRKAARIALETAKKADNFALDLKAKTEKIQIPQLDKNNILQSAEDINESANVINDKLNVLRERMILHKQQNGRAADEADELFSEGRDLLDRADMLMAQVHSASLDGTHANERIQQIMEKARVVIETILNAQDILLPEGQPDDDINLNLDDLRVDVKQLKDDLLPIETNAQSGIDLAKARYEDAKAIQEDAIKIHDNNSKLVDEAVRFNLEIEDKISDAKSALHKFEDGQNILQETSTNASRIANEAEEKMQKANSALHKSRNSEEYLETIKNLLEDLKKKNLMGLASNTWASTEDIREEIANAVFEYEGLRKKFDKFKADNAEDKARKTAEFMQHQTDLKNYERTRIDLAAQVNNLEEIRDTMPDWCTKDSNINEAAGARRNSRRGSDISEQT